MARYGGVYEHSPWVAERTLERGALPAVLIEGRGPAGTLHGADEAAELAEAMAGTMAPSSLACSLTRRSGPGGDDRCWRSGP